MALGSTGAALPDVAAGDRGGADAAGTAASTAVDVLGAMKMVAGATGGEGSALALGMPSAAGAPVATATAAAGGVGADAVGLTGARGGSGLAACR